LSKERIAILEAWASGDEDALDEFKDSSMFIDLDVHVDSDEYDIKKVEEWKFIIKAKKCGKGLLKPVAQDVKVSVEPLRTKEKVVLFAKVEESYGKAQMVGYELFMIIILFYIKNDLHTSWRSTSKVSWPC